jgi:hypothetical protein
MASKECPRPVRDPLRTCHSGVQTSVAVVSSQTGILHREATGWLCLLFSKPVEPDEHSERVSQGEENPSPKCSWTRRAAVRFGGIPPLHGDPADAGNASARRVVGPQRHPTVQIQPGAGESVSRSVPNAENVPLPSEVSPNHNVRSYPDAWALSERPRHWPARLLKSAPSQRCCEGCA